MKKATIYRQSRMSRIFINAITGRNQNAINTFVDLCYIINKIIR